MSNFAQLLDYHKHAGTRSVGVNGAAWSDASLARKAGTAPNTIRNWRTGRSVPEDPSALCDALFGNRHPVAREEFEGAWRDARGIAPSPQLDVSEHPQASTRYRRSPLAPSSGSFRITDRLEVDGLVELKLHATPGNSDETFRLDATVSFGILPFDYNDCTVEIALTDAEIAISSSAYQPVHRSRVCDRTDHPYLKPAPGGGIVVSGPLHRGVLYGDPLGPDHLAVMERVDDAEGPVTVEIRARSRASVRTETESAAASVNKQAIINAILSEGEHKDSMGRLVFARSRLMRRTPQ